MATYRASRYRAPRGALLALALTLAATGGGCGGSATPPSSGMGAAAARRTHTAAAPTVSDTGGRNAGAAAITGAAFTWLQPAAAPAGWSVVRLSRGAALFYPPGWRTVAGDRGTATAALLDARGRDVGYLNLTPRQGRETLANWSSFRLRHNRAEGERDVKLEGAARGLRFRTGRGSCVRDAYTTATGARYVEVACLVRGARDSAVVVGAALRDAWANERAAIERSLSALST